MELTSEAFENNSPIPAEYTSEGANISPPLRWTGQPEGTRSFVLICEDPDAPSGTFRHWGVFDIPNGLTEMTPGMADEADDFEFMQAENDFGDLGYGGPRPPRGDDAHRYFFRVIALNVEKLDLEKGCSIDELLETARDYEMDRAELMGTFERPRRQRQSRPQSRPRA